MESFFGVLKSEMFYGVEKPYQSLDALEKASTDYIFTITINDSRQNEKDSALCNIELNPLNN